MASAGSIGFVAFLAVSTGVLLVYTLVGGRRTQLDARLDDLSGRSPVLLPDQGAVTHLARTALPRVGATIMPSDEGERTLLKARLVHAGLYGRQAMPLFLGTKLVLMVAPAMAGLGAGSVGLVSGRYGLMGGACLGILGMIGPSFWLDQKKARRQSEFRRALPDALDVLAICLEGGLSLPGALRRIGAELRAAHPLLASELRIVERETQLGLSPGEALQQMGLRTDLEEVRSLASVIAQSERFGAGLVKSLRVHSDTLRTKRKQHAEERAQKAAVKILFPTLLFIFPAIFVVILGPAFIQISEFFRTNVG